MSEQERVDVVVVGAGMGGMYAVQRLRGEGLDVVGIEGAPDVGGVWFHNAYPGARVDGESLNYCYFFDPELFRDWKWTEKFATQPELLSYLNHVADRHDLRRHFLFETWVVGATWSENEDRWVIKTDTGRTIWARFLVMATGNLSKARDPEFPGLADFEGEWVQASHWKPVEIAGKRVAVVGTGSSGVQAASAIAKEAAELHVLQRTPLYSVPARNRPADPAQHERMSARVEGMWEELLATPGAITHLAPVGKTFDFAGEQLEALLESRWLYGSTSILSLFTDTADDLKANEIVGSYVARKNAERVRDPETAAKLTAYNVPIGVRRLILEIDYFEIFNQDNVHLVDVREDPIVRLVPSGIELASGRVVELDTIVFALGFHAFTGSLDFANITNHLGERPSDRWARGPATYLGLMTSGFPNLFTIAGPGSPTLTSNVCVANAQHIDVVGDLLAYMGERGYTRVEASPAAQKEWTEHAAELAEPLLRRKYDNYMVHVNEDDGSRVYMPYAGGMDRFVAKCRDVVANDFEGFDFATGPSQ
ncbi:NAD(P)/FAD-dependent oxidoreductase [Rhodococcus erythropolis]|uniref:flavin-containing monooxygenase n=1 Tax=Rhodococcus erythropolis TaxID=1833 RepID=UPI0029495AE7|nr:NAD(P)/FAD-dependent oxidoreductase [Rhodococcus erythropolis]MDV6212802.1 NAD(P)/FAD-dependent oxidoreductase [Rhodococcus erythropolis]